MSIVTVQIGQCGNRVGYEFFSTLSKEYAQDKDIARRLKFQDFNCECLDVFFDEVSPLRSKAYKYAARSVLVDMEAKVVDKVVVDARAGDVWRYDQQCQVVGRRGSGNNWASGFQQASSQVLEQVQDALVRQAENCDRLSGVMMMMSLGGGTGSGVGSVISCLVRDLFPHCLLLNQMTWSQAEVAVADYNSILSLSHTLPHSDCFLNHHNHQLHHTCLNQSHNAQVAFEDMNKQICKDLCFILSPSLPHPSSSSALSSSSSHPSSAPFSSSLTSADSLNNFIRHICSHPDYKFCRVVSPQYYTDHVHSYNTYHWNAVLKQLQQKLNRSCNNIDVEWLLRHNAQANTSNRSYSHMLMLRGNQVQQLDQEILKKRYLKITNAYPQFNQAGFACVSHPRSIFNDEKAGLVVSNDLCQMARLDAAVGKAWKMFNCKAFLHQYQRYGLEEADFMQSFASLEQVLSNYAHL